MQSSIKCIRYAAGHEIDIAYQSLKYITGYSCSTVVQRHGPFSYTWQLNNLFSGLQQKPNSKPILYLGSNMIVMGVIKINYYSQMSHVPFQIPWYAQHFIPKFLSNTMHQSTRFSGVQTDVYFTKRGFGLQRLYKDYDQMPPYICHKNNIRIVFRRNIGICVLVWEPWHVFDMLG